MDIGTKLDALSGSSFRAGFRLKGRDLQTAREKGLAVLRKHSGELLAKRLFQAFPPNDGKQTPMRGYPVFVAQHATATCCRSCLLKWHGVPKGRGLALAEQKYVLDVIEGWLHRQLELL